MLHRRCILNCRKVHLHICYFGVYCIRVSDPLVSYRCHVDTDSTTEVCPLAALKDEELNSVSFYTTRTCFQEVKSVRG